MWLAVPQSKYYIRLVVNPPPRIPQPTPPSHAVSRTTRRASGKHFTLSREIVCLTCAPRLKLHDEPHLSKKHKVIKTHCRKNKTAEKSEKRSSRKVKKIPEKEENIAATLPQLQSGPTQFFLLSVIKRIRKRMRVNVSECV